MRISPLEFGTPEFDEALDLRRIVLRLPLGLEFSETDIAAEYDQIHLGAWDHEGQLLACLSFLVISPEELKMRQVAVRPEYQGRGIGKRLVRYAEAWAKVQGYCRISMHARERAIPFYQQLGYRAEGDWFQEVTIPHKKMCRELPE